MPAPVQWHFGPFRLDPAQACLWHGADARRLPPKVWAVLQYLVTHPDRLITKDELLDAVWPATAVSDAVVRIAIGTVRKVLGDAVQTSRYIATVPGHGYRFLAPVTVTPVASSALPAAGAPSMSPSLLVEREAVLEHLQQALSAAQQGRRQVVVLTGEPGLGKTAVVEAFLAQVACTAAWVAVGQCVESYGMDEAYLPIFEALGQLCRGPHRARLVALLEHYAPTWLVQIPWLLCPGQRAQLQAELQGTMRERMLREGADVLDILTAERPLVLVLEDLHWSDAATLDLVTLVARRRTPARLLLLGTVRPGEMHMAPPPRHQFLGDLQRHQAVTLLPVPLLSAAAVATYLARCVPQQHVPDTLVAWLHQHTDGHPFFLVTLVQALLEQGGLDTHQGCWHMQADLAALAAAVPASLSQVLDQHILRLPPARQRVMEVASVVGVEFTAAMVAAGMEAAVDVVEAHCDALVAHQQLHALGVITWPHGTVTSCYRFRHALVQQALYARLGTGQRARLHRRLGAWLAAAYGEQAGDIAAVLADHFARGGDTPRAVAALHLAAEKAAQRYAHREVITLLRRAFPLLRQLPESPERTQRELALQMTLGPALMATQGQAAAEVAQTYARAHQLCQQVPATPQLEQSLIGLSHFYLMQGAPPTAHAIGHHLLQVTARPDEPTAQLSAHATLGITAMYLGTLEVSRTHLEQGLALAERQTPRPRALHALLDFGVICRNGLAAVVQQLGYPAQARQREQETLARSQTLASPFNRCNVLLFLALCPLFRREGPHALPWVEEALHLATRHGFPLYVALGHMVLGATRIVQGQWQEGIHHLRQGLMEEQALGAKVLHPWGLAMLAEGYAGLGQPDTGLGALAQAQALLATTRELFYAAEIARLHGELDRQTCAPGSVGAAAPAPAVEADTCFQQALAIARDQHARWWELRATVSVARLWQRQDKRAAAYALLAPIYGWFTEGFDTADLQEAKALLDELGG